MFIGSMTTGNATPMTEADPATARYSSISVSIYLLDTAKNASVAYDRLGSGLLGSFSNFYQGDGQERLVSEDLTGVGDQAMRSQLTITSTYPGGTRQISFQYITVQRGAFVFVVFAQRSVGPVESLPATSDEPDPMIIWPSRSSRLGICHQVRLCSPRTEGLPADSGASCPPRTIRS